MSRRKYNVNDNFFDVIDNQDKAYLLGLLYAEGCNYEDTHRIKLELAKSDIEILEKVKNILEFEGNIKCYNNENVSFGTDREYKCQDSARLLINSKRLSEQLALKGCVKNKSCILTFPNEDIVKKELYNHFIRGYMDGNGGISYWIDNENTGHKKFQVNFCGSSDMIIKVANILGNKFNCCPAIVDRFPDRDNNNLQFNICGNQVVKRILDWIYENANIYMQRKYNKYIELIEEVNRVNNDTNLYGNAFPRRKVIRLIDEKEYDTLSKAAKDNNILPGTMTYKCKKIMDLCI